MFDFKTIPVTLASSAPGWLLLACCRSNINIAIQDLRGRMINDMGTKSKEDPMGHNRLSMRITRFRKISGCLVWSKAPKDNALRDYLDEILPRRCIRTNSTKEFRSLFPHETLALELHTAGRFTNRHPVDDAKTSSSRVKRSKQRQYNAAKAEFDRSHPNGLPTQYYDSEDEPYQRCQQERAAAEKWSKDKSKESSHDPKAPPAASREQRPDKSAHSSRHPGEGIQSSHYQVLQPSAHSMSDLNHPETSELQNSGAFVGSTAESSSSNHSRLAVLSQGMGISNVNDPGTGSLEFEVVCVSNHEGIPDLHRWGSTNMVDKPPNSLRMAALVYELLHPTQIHYATLTGFEAPETNHDSCYHCQYMELQYILDTWHYQTRQLGLPHRLIGLNHFDSFLTVWNMPWIEGWFGPRLQRECSRVQTDGVSTW